MTYIWDQPEDDKLEVLSNDQLIERAEQFERDFFRTMQYWQHIPSHRVLVYRETNYEVDLDQMNTPSEYLGWILNLHGKQWMTAEALTEFITATNFLIEPTSRWRQELLP